VREFGNKTISEIALNSSLDTILLTKEREVKQLHNPQTKSIPRRVQTPSAESSKK
jgi:hypothetical protein